MQAHRGISSYTNIHRDYGKEQESKTLEPSTRYLLTLDLHRSKLHHRAFSPQLEYHATLPYSKFPESRIFTLLDKKDSKLSIKDPLETDTCFYL